jgi:hypothetical protein
MRPIWLIDTVRWPTSTGSSVLAPSLIARTKSALSSSCSASRTSPGPMTESRIPAGSAVIVDG